MTLLLLRHTLEPALSLGTLFLDGAHFCNTLEDAARLGAGFEKIYGQTAIPVGSYEVVLSVSKRFGFRTPEVLGVPGFTGIRIHPGNRIADTAGCILPGLVAGRDYVGESRAAFNLLMQRLTGLSHRLEVIEPLRARTECRAVWAEQAKRV